MPHRVRRAAGKLCLCVAFFLAGLDSVGAADPVLSLDGGLSFDSPWLRPGKLDTLYKHLPDRDQFNALVWSPIFKGGAGVILPEAGTGSSYGGGYVRPLLPLQGAGELILGGQSLNAPTQEAYEVQGEYRFPFGLGLGGGLLSTSQSNRDIEFGKVSFRDGWDGWSYILEAQAQAQAQAIADRILPGGYGALYSEKIMAVLGTDGEQWRATMGFVAPWTNAFVRPVVEVLYVDNGMRKIDGASSWFANASLRYSGGFLWRTILLRVSFA